MTETRKPLVACVGDNCLSRYEGSADELVAGNAANVAVRLSHAGMESVYIGAVGDDREGDLVRAGLEAERVNVSQVVIGEGRTGVAVVRSENDEHRVISADPGVAASLRINGAQVPCLLECTWVHCARLSEADCGPLALLAREGVSLSYDFGCTWTEKTMATFTPHLEAAFFDGRDLDDDEARRHVQRVVACGARCAIVMRGRHDVIAWAEGRLVQREARRVMVVDTLGASDAFIAGFIIATLAGAAADEAIDRGINEAAETCTYLGAWRPRGQCIFH
jgi:fructoselysine 6-kinase